MGKLIRLSWMGGLALVLVGCSGSRVNVLQSQLAEEQARRAALQTERDFLQAQLEEARTTQDSLQNLIREQEAMLAQWSSAPETPSDASAQMPDSEILEAEPVAVTSPPPAPRPEDLRSRYDEALNLYHQKQFGAARDLFLQLIAANLDAGLADNCQYWIGECYFAERQFETAIAEFEKVFAFPRSNKIDAAQYKIGLSYVLLKKNPEAREAFNRLIALYPASEYVERARIQLDKLP